MTAPVTAGQGHTMTHDGWANPVRWSEIYGNFSLLQTDIPVLWGTVEDSVDRMNEIGIKPLGAHHSPTHSPTHPPTRPPTSTSTYRSSRNVAARQ